MLICDFSSCVWKKVKEKNICEDCEDRKTKRPKHETISAFKHAMPFPDKKKTAVFCQLI
jgi:hypothetical protein